MKSAKRGSAISAVEMTQVSNRGLWLYLPQTKREYYLSFDDFPWFKDATVRQLSSIEVERGHILRWGELDVDLDLDRIENPDRYPLIADQPKKMLRVSDYQKEPLSRPVRRRIASGQPARRTSKAT